MVDQSGGSVAQQRRGQGREKIVSASGFDAESDHDPFGAGTLDVLGNVRGHRLFARKIADGRRAALQSAEIAVDKLNGSVEIQIAAEQKRDVFRRVITAVEFPDFRDGRIFQMFGVPDERRPPVGMRRKQTAGQRLEHQAVLIVLSLVEFLVNGFQFGMEETHDRIAETFGFQLQKFLQFLRGNVHHIDRHVGGGERVEPHPADGGNQFAVFAGGGIFRGFRGKFVDFGIQFRLFCRISGSAPFFKQGFDPVEERFFLRIVQRPDFPGALEHHVFEVMRQSGHVRGRVRHAGPDRRPEGDARFDGNPGKIDLHAVFQRVFAGVVRVVRHKGVGIAVRIDGPPEFIILCRQCQDDTEDQQDCQAFFHQESPPSSIDFNAPVPEQKRDAQSVSVPGFSNRQRILPKVQKTSSSSYLREPSPCRSSASTWTKGSLPWIFSSR